MNQSKSKTLRRVFAAIRPFSPSDARNRTAYRDLKRRYNEQPRTLRASFIAELWGHVEDLKAQMAAQQAASGLIQTEPITS